jgi:bacterioferritin-associated ferredoxin
MIVCHCATITDHEIRAAVDWMRAADPDTIITPGKVYRALGRQADCGGCLPLFVAEIQKCATLEVPANLRGLRRATSKGDGHEGGRQGHRVSQRGATQ